MHSTEAETSQMNSPMAPAGQGEIHHHRRCNRRRIRHATLGAAPALAPSPATTLPSPRPSRPDGSDGTKVHGVVDGESIRQRQFGAFGSGTFTGTKG